MTRTLHKVTQLVVVAAMLSLVWPVPAHAQHHGHGHGGFVVHGGYGFYYPGFYYSGWAGPYGWYGYPWGGWGAWGPWGPYPGYGYYDSSSSARIQGPPPQAEVYVDGYFAGVVDDFDGSFQRLRVPPGQHEIVIYLEGYRSTKQNILFRPGAGYKITATLEKLPPGEPNEPKPHPSEISTAHVAPARAGDRGQQDDDRGETMTAAPMQQASGFGTLAVRVQPAGATVLVDGERWEGSDATGERLVLQVAEGHHRVEVRREGYQPYSTEVDVRSGQTATLNVSLPQERR